MPGLSEPDLLVRCDLRAVQGSHQAGRLDPALRFLRGQLRRAPLSRYKQLSQLSRHQLQLAPRAPQVVALADGGQPLELTLLERVPWQPRRERYRLRLAPGTEEGGPAAPGVQLLTLRPGKVAVLEGATTPADLLVILTCRRGGR